MTDYRSAFPLIGRCVYLNSNATGATPQSAQQVLDDYWHTLAQWRDEVWRHWWTELSSHADAIAMLLGAPQGSVICDTNLATLLSRVMSCLDFRGRPGWSRPISSFRRCRSSCARLDGTARN